ncbi:ROK family transcriptional regulator [Amycolatopsis mongoliensis]|uniref:ROK family transcriptional regulator n=1 Tax=Amycolatopsis mongoliensis TaxID=715475 RepID=A0A9Y2JVD4_9PSEU|nr:ROK family transcriptional regulator [Amycolatopsis sp. 4-36]WIY05426.1 ROK family transcriptional regulator [Amycolatopsis sp. 4-36]
MTQVVRQTTRDLRRHNRAALLSSLYLRGPVSRLELVAESGLSAATVTNVVSELIADGVVAEAGSVESDGGRPRTLLAVRPDFGHVVGVDVGETHVEVGLFDCALGTLGTVRHPLVGTRLDPDEVAGLVRTGIAEVLEGGEPDAVFGVGIGVPGAVRDGGIVHAPTLGWRGVAFADLIRPHVDALFTLGAERGPMPVHLDNRARTLGQAETWRGAGRGAERAIVALLGVGVGAAVATAGRSHPDITTSEWGHTVVKAGGAACRCGSHGCLEAYVGTEAVVRHYADLVGKEPVIGDESDAELVHIVAEAAVEGPAADVLAEAAEYLGIGIANLINLLSPDRVVLSGSAGAIMGPAILPAVRDAVSRHALDYLAERTEVVLGRLGPEAVALGAATLPIAQLLATGGRTG